MADIEISHVKEIYNRIALHFDKTRNYIWKDVKLFLDKLGENNLILDAGCGNGKNMFNNNYFIGIDFCKHFLDLISKKKKEAIQLNIKKLSFRDNAFDHVICIAVLHHIVDKNDRMNVINELVRIVKPSGRILISVWKVHKNYRHGDNFIKWGLQGKYNSINNISEDLFRYYYMYTLEDIKCEIHNNIKGIILDTIYVSNNNIFIELIKL